MIPFKYFIALSLSLVIIVCGIIEIFYPMNEEGNSKFKKVLFFFLGFSWVLAFFDGTELLTYIFAIICGILSVYCYSLFDKNGEVKQAATNETIFSPEDYFGLKGQVYAVIEDENNGTKHYMGSIIDSSYRIEFLSNDQTFKKYDYFQITGFENGHFIGEKIINEK